MRSERRKMSFWKGHKLYCVLLVVSLLSALGLRLVYEGVSSRMSVNDFQKVFTERYVEAQRELRRLPEVVFARGLSERERLETKASKSHITYCLYRYGRLAYWSDNRMPVSQWEDVDMMSPGVVKIGNYYCFPLTMYRGGNTSVAYITMKTDYPVKSSYLQDHFIDGFNMDASVRFVRETRGMPMRCSRQTEGICSRWINRRREGHRANGCCGCHWRRGVYSCF